MKFYIHNNDKSRNNPASTFLTRTFLLLLLTTTSTKTVRSQECTDSYATCSTRTYHPITTDLTSYYATAENLTGSTLKAELNNIVKAVHKKYSYNCVWTALAEIDKDETMEDHVVAIYTQRSIHRLNRDSCTLVNGERNTSSDAWNREHLWPKSHGFPNSSQYAYTDLHHLVPADKSVNTDRSHNDFQNGGSTKVCNENDLCCTECKEDSVNKTWEPPEIVKGQIARMMLYMDVRYEGNDVDVTDTPDLTLVDESSQEYNVDNPDLTYYPELGYLSTLLQWHCQYPVSKGERERNNRVESWQGNRNPFIDRPDLVKLVWNDAKFDPIWQGCDDASVWINEFHYDNSGSDSNEFVEIGCNKEINMEGYQIILFNGNDGMPYGTPATLSGICTPPDNFIVQRYPRNGIQNGHDGIALFDPNDEIVEFLSYEGTVTASSGSTVHGLESVDVGVQESSSTSKGFSLQKVGTGCQGSDFVWQNPAKSSEGRVNDGQIIDCGL